MLVQGVLDATSIELATRLIDSLVCSLTDLSASLQAMQQQQQQQQPQSLHKQKHDHHTPIWAPALMLALSEIIIGACRSSSSSSSSSCAHHRGVLLSLLPLLEIGRTLGASPAR
jgi:hypothetical protein